MIKHITQWVVGRALGDLKTLQRVHPSLNMSVNISARDLLSPGLEDLFLVALEEHDLKAADVMLELTETAAMDDPEAGPESPGKPRPGRAQDLC